MAFVAMLSYFVSAVLFVLFVVYLLFAHRYGMWRRKGVPGPTPAFPFGNIREMIVDKIHVGHQFQRLYERHKGAPYVGVFMFYRPTLLVNDLDLAKTILVKDFNHFTDHTLPYNPKYEPLGGHLFNSKGAKWKGVRSKLTPAFTSNKMKYMFDVMAECGTSLERFFESDAVLSADVDVKDVMAKFTTDIIVSCAFGVESDSLANPEAEFRRMGQKLLSFDLRKGVVLFMNIFAPMLMSFLPLAFIDEDVSDFFIRTVYDVIEHREKNNVARNDLMQLLIKLKNNESIDEQEGEESKKLGDSVVLNKLEIAAEAFGFFVAGFETSSTASACLLYELAENPDIQERLRDEIEEALSNTGGKTTYNALNEMSYMTQVIEEALRKYPPIPHVFRLCTKEYTIPGTNVTLEKGSRVVVPIMGIQKDPNYYPDPEKFDPDRFLPENKAARHNFSFLPFGEGPRICIGMRFAMMQIRLALVSILRQYEVIHSESSKNGVKFDRRNIFMSPEGLKLRFRKR